MYALPGKVGDKNSEASNLLLKNGAKLVTSAEDIIKAYDNGSTGLLNPFNLQVRLPIDVMEALRKYEVVAVTQGDDIFTPPRQNRAKVDYLPTSEAPKEEEPAIAAPPDSFDKNALKLYKKIPFSGVMSIESLVSEEFSLRDVMKLLLKLEMGKFVVMLPGERVARKSN